MIARDIEIEGMDMNDFFRLALKVEKRWFKPKLITTPVVNEEKTGARPTKCHYCGREGHVIKHCTDKKRGIKPYQAHLDWGRKVYGEEFKWDFKKKSKDKASKNTKTMLVHVEDESKEECKEAVTIVTFNVMHSQDRCVAIFKADFKQGDGYCDEEVHTLADSGGCENGINRLYVLEKGHKIYQCLDYNHNSRGTSATGNSIEFREYVKVDMRLGGKVINVRFYIMDGLPRNFLIGYPWLVKYGGVVDAQEGTLTIKNLNLIISLEGPSRNKKEQGVFAAFGQLQSSPVPIVTLSNVWEGMATMTINRVSVEVEQLRTTGKEKIISTPFTERVENLFNTEEKKAWDDDLKKLLMEFEDVFNTTSIEPAAVEPIHVDLKEE